MDYAASPGAENFIEIDPTITTTGSGTFDITVLHTHTISSGTIDGVALTSGQISSLQSDINATNQYHTLAGTTLIVYYTSPILPQSPTNLATTTGIPIELDWDAPADDGGSAITGYKVYRTTNQFALTDMPDSQGSDSQIDMAANEILLHLDSVPAYEDVTCDLSLIHI